MNGIDNYETLVKTLGKMHDIYADCATMYNKTMQNLVEKANENWKSKELQDFLIKVKEASDKTGKSIENSFIVLTESMEADARSYAESNNTGMDSINQIQHIEPVTYDLNIEGTKIDGSAMNIEAINSAMNVIQQSKETMVDTITPIKSLPTGYIGDPDIKIKDAIQKIIANVIGMFDFFDQLLQELRHGTEKFENLNSQTNSTFDINP